MGRFIYLLVFILAIYLPADAQPGIPEMQEAYGFLRNSFFSMRDFCNVLAALIAIFGAIKVYHKWQMGRDVTLDISAWFFSSLFIIVIGVILVHVFGL